jgi:two-component system, OmpR family, phosphate regulon response regulator PhoB
MISICIIDDDNDSRELLQAFLRRKKFAVEIFSTAEDFLTAPKTPSDLYILDINLGGLSGLDVCRQLKNDEETKDKKILIISAHPEIEKLSQQACADDFLPRPFSQSSLIEKITSLTNNS